MTEQVTFNTRIHLKEINSDLLTVESPRTGQCIYIHQGWIPEIDKVLFNKIYTAWRKHEADARASVEGRYAYMMNKKCFIPLTLAELKELHRVFTIQYKEFERRNSSRNR